MPRIIVAVLFLMGALGWVTWTIDSTDGGTYPSTKVIEMAEPSYQIVVVSSRTVDSAGADIAVGHTGSPIDGLVIHFPPQSMEKAGRITVGYSTRSVPIRAGRGSGIIITLQADGISKFLRPVAVEVHYQSVPPPSLAIPYRIDASDRLHVMDIARFDAANSMLIFNTFSPGDFTWIYQ